MGAGVYLTRCKILSLHFKPTSAFVIAGQPDMLNSQQKKKNA